MRKMFFHGLDWQTVCIVYLCDIIFSHQRQGSQSKKGMENVGFVSWSVCEPTIVKILTVHDIPPQRLKIDQILPVNHEAGGEDPP